MKNINSGAEFLNLVFKDMTDSANVSRRAGKISSYFENEVFFEKDGGTEGSVKVIAVYDSQMPEATAPIKLGYVFKGYFEKSL